MSTSVCSSPNAWISVPIKRTWREKKAPLNKYTIKSIVYHDEGGRVVDAPRRKMFFSYDTETRSFCWLPGCNTTETHTLKDDMSWCVKKEMRVFTYRLAIDGSNATITRYVTYAGVKDQLVASEYYALI